MITLPPYVLIALKGAGTIGAIALTFYTLRFLYKALFHLFLVESDEPDESEFVGRFSYAFAGYFLSIAGLLLVTGVACVLSVYQIWGISWSVSGVVKALTEKWVYRLDKYHVIGLVQIGQLLSFIGAGIALINIVQMTILEYMYRMFLTPRGTRAVVNRVVRYALLALSLVFGLQYVGLGQHVWQLVLVMSFGITMGIKDIILDMFASVWMLLERDIEPTDYIEIGGTNGYVKNMGIRSTSVETERGIVNIPNRVFIGKEYVNWSKVNSRLAVRDFMMTVEETFAAEEVVEKVLEYFKVNNHLYSPPKSGIHLEAFNAKSNTFRVTVAFKRKYFVDQDEALHEVKLALRNLLYGAKKAS